jgi:hypothetical protein
VDSFKPVDEHEAVVVLGYDGADWAPFDPLSIGDELGGVCQTKAVGQQKLV